MHLLLSILYIIFLSTNTALFQYVIRGEKTRYAIICPIPNGHWLGPYNQSIVNNSNKYKLKYSFNSVQLIIEHLTSHDEGEYVCQNNQTNHIVKQFELKLGTIKSVLLPFFILTFSILIFIPMFWFLGRNYSGINQ